MTPISGPRPACVKRQVVSPEGYTATFHACWLHADRLEDETFDVDGYKPVEGVSSKAVDAAERDDSGTWCAFCN
jgi:hypothetical protein